MIVSLSKKKKKKETAQPNVSRSRSVDKHYPFTRSSLTDKPIIRHSTLTRPTILSITAAGPPRGQKEERDERCGESWCGGGDPNRGGATRRGSRKREGDAERERERKEARVFPRRESYNSTKHNPRVNLTSPPCKSELDQRRKGRVGRERRTGRERGIRYG